MDAGQALFASLLRLADDHLVLGHRLSQWCGHAPMLEEDLSMPNIALDLIGQARALYTYAGLVEGKGRDEDQLAYLRLEREYQNLLLCEREIGDFAHTMLRQLFFSLYMEQYWTAAASSKDATVAAIAAKALKEARYHVRHSAEWVIRLGDGTQESAIRIKAALDQLAPYVGEMFESDEVTKAVSGLLPNPADLKQQFLSELAPIFAEANLTIPDFSKGQSGGRKGRHGEAMGYLLAELQYMQRTYPGMRW